MLVCVKLKVLGLFVVLVVKLKLIVVGYVVIIFLEFSFIERFVMFMYVCLYVIFLWICFFVDWNNLIVLFDCFLFIIFVFLKWFLGYLKL